MGKEVRIFGAEARHHNFVTLGAAVLVGVAVETDVGAVLDVGAVAIGLHAERHDQSISEDAGRAGCTPVRIGGAVGGVEDDDAVTPAAGEQCVGGGFVFVGVDRILQRGHAPEPHAGVPRHRDELAYALRLRGHQFDFKSLGQPKRRLLLARRASGFADGVVAAVGRVRSRRSGRRWRRGRGRRGCGPGAAGLCLHTAGGENEQRQEKKAQWQHRRAGGEKRAAAEKHGGTDPGGTQTRYRCVRKSGRGGWCRMQRDAGYGGKLHPHTPP